MSLLDNLPASIASDYQYMDGIQDLTYERPSTSEEWSIKGFFLKAKETEIGGVLSLTEVIKICRVFAATLNTEPKPGDVILDGGGVRWTVMPWDQSKMKDTSIAYDLQTVKQA